MKKTFLASDKTFITDSDTDKFNNVQVYNPDKELYPAEPIGMQSASPHNVNIPNVPCAQAVYAYISLSSSNNSD